MREFERSDLDKVDKLSPPVMLHFALGFRLKDPTLLPSEKEVIVHMQKSIRKDLTEDQIVELKEHKDLYEH